jgi:hypothetical protein
MEVAIFMFYYTCLSTACGWASLGPLPDLHQCYIAVRQYEAQGKQAYCKRLTYSSKHPLFLPPLSGSPP